MPHDSDAPSVHRPVGSSRICTALVGHARERVVDTRDHGRAIAALPADDRAPVSKSICMVLFEKSGVCATSEDVHDVSTIGGAVAVVQIRGWQGSRSSDL
jgi:hypothetical protein